MGLFKKDKKDKFKKINPAVEQEINPMEELEEEMKAEGEDEIENESETEEEGNIDNLEKEIRNMNSKIAELKQKKQVRQEQVKQEQIKIMYLTEAEMLREILLRVQNIEGWASNLINYLKEKGI